MCTAHLEADRSLESRRTEIAFDGEDRGCQAVYRAVTVRGVTGAEVRRIRTRLSLTQAALACALGVSRVTVARWETGVYAIPEPTARLLQRIRDERRRAKRSR